MSSMSSFLATIATIYSNCFKIFIIYSYSYLFSKALERAHRVPVTKAEFLKEFDSVAEEVKRDEEADVEEEKGYEAALGALPMDRDVNLVDMTRFCCNLKKDQGELKDEDEWNNPEVNY